MKQTLIYLALILPISSFGSSDSNTISIAVYKIKSETISNEFANVLSDHIESTLLGFPCYRVIARSNLDVLITEDHLQESGLLQNEPHALDNETRSSIDKICTGSVSRAGSNYSFTLKIIDVGSGRIDAAAQRLYGGSTDGLLPFSDTLVRCICNQSQQQQIIDTVTVVAPSLKTPGHVQTDTAPIPTIHLRAVLPATDTLQSTDTITRQCPAALSAASTDRAIHAEPAALKKRPPSKRGKRISLGATIIFGTLAALLLISRN